MKPLIFAVFIGQGRLVQDIKGTQDQRNIGFLSLCFVSLFKGFRNIEQPDRVGIPGNKQVPEMLAQSGKNIYAFKP